MTDALTAPTLHIVRDPANNLEAVEAHGVVSYVVAQQSWRQAATARADR